jgi:lipoprotein signal peptidase
MICHTGLVSVNAGCEAVLVGTALAGIGLDQAAKVLVVASREGKPPIQIAGRILTIYVTRNPGAAFGFAPAATVLFTGVAVAAAVVIIMKVVPAALSWLGSSARPGVGRSYRESV